MHFLDILIDYFSSEGEELCMQSADLLLKCIIDQWPVKSPSDFLPFNFDTLYLDLLKRMKYEYLKVMNGQH